MFTVLGAYRENNKQESALAQITFWAFSNRGVYLNGLEGAGVFSQALKTKEQSFIVYPLMVGKLLKT